jgi:hypothetical protein
MMLAEQQVTISRPFSSLAKVPQPGRQHRIIDAMQVFRPSRQGTKPGDMVEIYEVLTFCEVMPPLSIFSNFKPESHAHDKCFRPALQL